MDVYVQCLRMPYHFEMDLRTCRRIHDDDHRCFQVDRVNLTVRVRTPICNQCALNLMSTVSVNNVMDTKTAHIIGSRTIATFTNMMASVFHPNPNHLYFFLQSKEHLTRYLLTMHHIIRSTKNRGDTAMCKAYTVSVTHFMQFVGWKRHLVRWFIEAEDGRFFSQFVVAEFKKYKAKNGKKRGERFFWMYFVITHLARYEYRYLSRSKIKKHQTEGTIQRNYEWIERTLVQNANGGPNGYDYNYLDFMFCPNSVRTQYREFKDLLERYRVCDNRDCKKANRKDKVTRFWRCRRCRMMYYCSRRCQKVDWNKYNHRSLCFEYPLQYRTKRRCGIIP